MDTDDFTGFFIAIEDLFSDGGLSQRDLSLLYLQSMIT
jgi:hypothetical protein